MTKLKLWLLASFLVVGTSSALHAQGRILNEYTARLSEQDHFSSDGVRLTSPAAIIRQDRANFYKFHRADAEDEADRYFDTAEHRERLESMLEHGHTDRRAYKAIVDGTPLIHVIVFREGEGVYIDVKVIGR